MSEGGVKCGIKVALTSTIPSEVGVVTGLSDCRIACLLLCFLSAIQGFRDWCKSGSNKVGHVIDAIVSPLTSQFPKRRYVIGWDAWQLKLSCHLPEVLQDLLVRDFPFKNVIPPSQDVTAQPTDY